MRAVRRILSLLIYIAPLVVLIFLGIQMVRRYYRTAERNLAPVLEAEATRALGHEVRVGRVTIQGRYAYVDDVHIAEASTLAEGGAIATARQVVLDFDLRKILFEKDLKIPLFSHVRVLDPVARISRDRNGRWNFADLFRPRPGPEKRPAVGRVVVSGGTVHYVDAALPRNPRRPAVPFQTRLGNVGGFLQFDADRSYTWQAKGQGTGRQVQSVYVLGTYEPGPKRLFLRIQADRLAAIQANRFLPPDAGLTAGTVSGIGTLIRVPGMPGPLRMDLQADLKVDGVRVVSTRIGEPVQQIRGAATLSNSVATVKLDAGFTGSPLHIEGTVLGWTKDPTLNGWASGSGVQLQRVLTALNLDQRYPALRDLRVVADARAYLSGPLGALDVRATGPASVGGGLPGGAALPSASRLQVAFNGSVRSPRIQLMGTLPRLRYRQYEARNVWLAGIYSPERASVDFTAQVAGGQVAGRALVKPDGPRTRYQVTARARGVSLVRLPLNTLTGGERIAGIVSADLVAQGRLDTVLPEGAAAVHAADVRYGDWTARVVRARLRAEGGRIRIMRLVVDDPKGLVVASGITDPRRQSLDVTVGADGVDLAVLPIRLAAGEQVNGGEERIQGQVFLREGRVTGTYRDPRLSGRLLAYNFGVGRMMLDYADARLRGDRRELIIENGTAMRYPAVATLEGIVRRPLSSNPRLMLDGTFRYLDLQDVAQMAGRDLDIAGIAHGSFEVSGPVRAPVITGPITVEEAVIGEYTLQDVTARVGYDPAESKGTWNVTDFQARLLNATAQSGYAPIAGNARLTGDRRFVVNARIENVDLALLDPRISEYASVTGNGSLVLDEVKGRLEDGKAKDLVGNLTLQATQLTVNREPFGNLTARLSLDGPLILSREVTLGPVGAPGSEIRLTSLRYDQTSRDVSAMGAVDRLPVEAVQRAISNSPFVAMHSESVAAEWLRPIARPFQGLLDGSFNISGTTDIPRANVTWKNNGEMVLAGQTVQTFQGDVTFTPESIDLNALNLTAGQAVVTLAEKGALVLDKSLSGAIQINNMPLELLRSWFPDRKELAGLQGVVDFVYIDARDTRPSSPELTVSLELDNLSWSDPRVLSGRSFKIDSLAVSRAVIHEGGITADDIAVTVEEPEPAPVRAEAVTGKVTPASSTPPPKQPPKRHTAYASGSVGFSWKDFFGEDPAVNLQVRIGGEKPADPGEDLSILTAFAPEARGQIEGQLKAKFNWTGTLRKPTMTGELAIAQQPGQRIRLEDMTTSITGLDAVFRLAGNTIVADRFRAFTEVINPRTNVSVYRSEPVTLTGDLALHEGVPGDHRMRLEAPRIYVAEAPLPNLRTGRLLAKDLSASLNIAGTVSRPDIYGRVNIAQTDFRMPDTLMAETTGVMLPIRPSFRGPQNTGVQFTVGENVRISTAQLSAQVHTSPGEAISLSGDLEQPQLTGNLVVERGTLTFPTARFAIQRGGSVTLRYPYYAAGDFAAPTMGLIVDVTATTRLTARSVTGVSKRYTITVEARGPINSGAQLELADPSGLGGGPSGGGLQLAFRSDPPDLALSQAGLQQRVTGLLGGQSAIEQLFSGSPDIGRILSQQLTGVLSNTLFPELFERLGLAEALGFEEFTLETDRLEAFTLHISRRLFGPIYLSYSQRISGATGRAGTQPAAWEFKLSYRIQDNVQFSWTSDEQRTNAFLLEGVFKF